MLAQGARHGAYSVMALDDGTSTCKEPLLMKSHDISCSSGQGADTLNRRYESWKAAVEAEKARDDAAEAQGQGLYALHAVIGQGSFGRIHLASWRRGESHLGLEGRAADPSSSHDNCARKAAGGYSRASSLAVVAAGVLRAGARKWLRKEERSSRDDTRARGLASQPDIESFDDGDMARDCDPWNGDDEAEVKLRPRLRALKSVCKRKVTEKGLAKHMQAELTVLKRCSHPFIVSLSPGGHFQTTRHLHLVLNYCPGGDLFSLLRVEERLAEQPARVCAAQIALALKHLHDRHIVYRDLKPENVCIDARGRAVLVDFSLARMDVNLAEDGKAFTVCGSAAYIAPEMLAKKGYDTRVDLWSLGCVLFEVLTGWHPFRKPRERSDRKLLFERIARGRPKYPSSLSKRAVSLLRGLLEVDPDARLGFPAAGVHSSASPRHGAGSDDIETNGSARQLLSQSPKPLLARVDSEGTRQSHEARRAREAAPTVVAGQEPPDSARAFASPGEEGVIRGNTGSCDGDKEGDTDTLGTVSGGCRDAAPRDTAPRAKHRPASRRPIGKPPDRAPQYLLEHGFFGDLPGWGGPETGGAWDDSKLEDSAVVVPTLRDALDVQHFDRRFTQQAVELVLQGHPHKGGPTPDFEGFEWRPDSCIEYRPAKERRHSGYLGSMVSALWC